jgi:cytochrome b561
VVKDLVEAPPLIFKINGGLAKVVHLLLLLMVLALLVLGLLLKAGVFSLGFLDLRLQPLHRNGVTLFHPLESGLQLGSICMAEIIAKLID